MVVFSQPTFHKYFLEKAQGRTPNLAYSFSDVTEFTHLGFCLPHLPSSGGTGVLLGPHKAPVVRWPVTVFAGLFSRDLGLLVHPQLLHTRGGFSRPFPPPSLLCTPSPQSYSPMKMTPSGGEAIV